MLFIKMNSCFDNVILILSKNFLCVFKKKKLSNYNSRGGARLSSDAGFREEAETLLHLQLLQKVNNVSFIKIAHRVKQVSLFASLTVSFQSYSCFIFGGYQQIHCEENEKVVELEWFVVSSCSCVREENVCYQSLLQLVNDFWSSASNSNKKKDK